MSGALGLPFRIRRIGRSRRFRTPPRTSRRQPVQAVPSALLRQVRVGLHHYHRVWSQHRPWLHSHSRLWPNHRSWLLRCLELLRCPELCREWLQWKGSPVDLGHRARQWLHLHLLFLQVVSLLRLQGISSWTIGSLLLMLRVPVPDGPRRRGCCQIRPRCGVPVPRTVGLVQHRLWREHRLWLNHRLWLEDPLRWQSRCSCKPSRPDRACPEGSSGR